MTYSKQSSQNTMYKNTSYGKSNEATWMMKLIDIVFFRGIIWKMEKSSK